MKFKKLISMIVAYTISLSLIPAFNISVSAFEDYNCDFTQLVKENADTVYGTSEDIYQLDDYTSAYLTYDGTYVSADGKIYLKSSTIVNGTGKYAKGSYIKFIAPTSGTVNISGQDIGICINDGSSESYMGYGSSRSYELTEGQILYAGYRKSSTYVSSLTFTPSIEATEVPTTVPSEDTHRELLYSENFEGYETDSDGGWTSPSGKVSVKQDSKNTSINNYLAVTSNKSGTARSGYKEITNISDDFVLEADIKTTAYQSNVSAFEILESKSSLYVNHGCYSNAEYAFKMNRPKGLNQYVINNRISDSGLSVDRYEQPPVLTKEIPDEWLHLKVIGDFSNKTATVYLTSLDNSTMYYHGRTNMSEGMNEFKCLTMLSPSSGVDTCIDNIKIFKALDTDLSEVFHTVSINDGISEFLQYVYDGECVTNIPDISFYGEHFLGWKVNGVLYSNEELKTLKINANSTITAEVSADYIEKLASVEFNNFPADNILTMGADGDTYADNEISLTIIGEKGTSFVTSPDSRVNDYKIDWSFDGFRTLNGNPTYETGESYCDSYANISITSQAQSKVNFKLKNTSANYYGRVNATVTYNGKSITVSKPLLLLADKTQDEGTFLPKPGYTADYNKYDEALAGYHINSDDLLTGGWSTSGSDSTSVYLQSDATGKYLNLSRGLIGNSSYIYQEIGNISAQTVFSQDIRYNMSATIAYGSGDSSTSLSSTAFELSYSSSELKLNGATVCEAQNGKWYHIEITADPTTKLCFAKIYDFETDGDYTHSTPLALTDTVSFKDGYTFGHYYRITLSKERGSIDINNVSIKQAQTDESSICITAPQTLNIPQSGTSTTELSISAAMTNGDLAIGTATWQIDDELATGVSIESTGANTATLTVDSTAVSGELPIKITLNGTSITKIITLIGTKDSVSFAKAPLGVQIPPTDSVKFEYKAEVRNPNAEAIPDRTISYTLYNEDSSAMLNDENITLSSDGILTITKDANAQIICIKASSMDSDGNIISKTIRVNVYALKFDFGTGTPADGYTSVSSSLSYSENRGFGITGTSTDNESTLSGTSFGFKVKLEKGEVYNINIVYSGTIKCERMNSKLTGFERTQDSLAADSYKTAVFGDGILDITFSGNGEIDSISIEKLERTASEKPSWWTIGDSTVQQNGSWAYQLEDNISSYPTLNNVISNFYNSGRAGRQHRSYYSEGLFNSVLSQLNPGDVVSISGMGTNDSTSTKDEFKSYNNCYIDAIEDMGGYVILGSYTPTGNYGATEGKVYDSDSVTFRGMRTNAYDTAIREVYDERIAAGDNKILGFIDIGKISDNLMTNDVRAEYNKLAQDGKTIMEALEAANAKAEEMMAWWKDYNHYYSNFSNYILPEITTRAAQLISGEEQDKLPEVVELSSITPDVTPAPTSPPVPTENTIDVIYKAMDKNSITIKTGSGFCGIMAVAMYDLNGKLEKIFFEDDNTSISTFTFNRPDIINGYTIKLINWDNLNSMIPYGEAICINLEDIENISAVEITSSEEYIDVTSLAMYDNTSCRMYKADNSYEEVSAIDGKVHNTTGKEVTVVPIYRFEFTNTEVSDDMHINGYVKVTENSYTKEKGYGLLSNIDYSINENGCKPSSGCPIKADVPDGFYDITVYRKGGVRADVLNNDVQIINNTTSYGSQNRPSGSGIMNAPRMAVTDGINLTFKNTSGNSERIASVEIIRVPEKHKKQVIWIAGDSESANYYPINTDGDDLDSSKIMMTGFGMQLDKFMSDKYAIANYGQPSATIKTWYNECFESVNKLMQSGDTLIMDFGINEVASSSNSISIDEMKAYMQLIANTAKEKGVTPVLASPVYNGKYQSKAYFTYNTASKENEMYDFAKETDIEYIDLNKFTQLYVNEAIADTGDASWISNNYHVSDNLHLTQHSALLTASFIAAKLNELGYETSNYTYTYHDISSINTEDYTRAEESGITRVYSVENAKEFITKNTDPEPVSVKEWSFEENPVLQSGDNVPVLEGNVIWSEENQNIKFDANSASSGTLSLNLNPAISNDATIAFDLNVGALGSQYFSYSIKDTEENNLISCSFDDYNNTATLTIGNTVIATNSDITAQITSARGDGMSAATTSFINEIDFSKNTVTLTIGTTVITGQLTGAETGAISQLEFTSSRSKTADRSIYLDNILIKEYNAKENATAQTAFPAFCESVYTSADNTAIPYRYYLPSGYDSTIKYPVTVYLHAQTRNGSDNEKHLYNAQYLFNEIIKNEADNPSILIAPQCTDSFASDIMVSGINALIDDFSVKYSVDSQRIYLAGYKEGANACYDIAVSDKYAAIIAISGTGNTQNASAISANNTAVMAINGSEDDTATGAKAMIKAINDAGSYNTEYVELYGKSGNIQEKAATKEGVIDWMFSKNLTLNNSQAKTVDLAIFMGQSNMAGRGSYQSATVCPIGHGYEFRSVTQPDMLFNITGPFGKNENNDAINDNSGSGSDRRSGDMVSSVMESYYIESGVPIVGVQCSRGGTDTSYWNSSAQKAEAKARLLSAKTYLEENGYTINNVFMVWCQGESDADKIYSGNRTVEGYKSATLSVFNYMKEVGVENMFIVNTGHFNGEDDENASHESAYISVNNAQTALAEENDNIYSVGSFLEYKDNMIDAFHYDQTAYNEVGTTVGKNIAQILK